MTDALRSLLHDGGWVLAAILIVSMIAWTLIVWEWLRLRDQQRGGWDWIHRAIDDVAHDRPFREDEAAGVDPSMTPLVGQLIRTGLRARSHDRASFEAQIMPLLRSQAVMLQRPLALIAVLAATMPLLGLLGTVLGMMHTFDALTARGLGRIDALAEGISQALITTQAGLLVAVPVVLIHSYLAARVRRHVETSSVMIKRLETVVCHD
jgi:biopolymer transport protein ExbB